ncbi:MAG: hypothetical protein IPO28_13045 [Holophagaceae bacterium]|nr:hypothetical protein [Holophagaceae bacterium]
MSPPRSLIARSSHRPGHRSPGEGLQGQEEIAQGEAFDASPENVEARTVRFTTPNGLKAALLSRKTKGAMASLQLTLRFGREAELMDRKAVPGLTGAMLMRGTTKHTRQELA